MKKTITLWTIQGLLAALFLFAGGFKLVMPIEAMKGPGIQLPGMFLRFIGVCEILGAIGLILPAAFKIQAHLTPLAALGLVVIMIGAVVISWIGFGLLAAILPLIVGLLAALVAYERRGYFSQTVATNML